MKIVYICAQCQFKFKRGNAFRIKNISEEIWRNIVTLPSSTSITEEEINYVIKSLNKIIQ